MGLNNLKNELLKNPEVKKAYEDKSDLAFETGRMLFKARMMKGITQKKLADELGTQQPSIARVESGAYLPTLGFLQKIAKIFNTYLLPPKFAFMEEKPEVELSSTPFNESGLIEFNVEGTSDLSPVCYGRVSTSKSSLEYTPS